MSEYEGATRLEDTDSWNSCDDFTQLQFVQNGSLTSGIETDLLRLARSTGQQVKLP